MGIEEYEQAKKEHKMFMKEQIRRLYGGDEDEIVFFADEKEEEYTEVEE